MNTRGKHVLITGAGSGIGRQTALAFAKLGAHLELVDIDRAGLDETSDFCTSLGVQLHTHLVDVTDADAMQTLADSVHLRIAALDVLVNNAGIGAAGRFLETSLATWHKTMDVNLMGVVHGCRVFLPAMVARGQGGKVVNVASAAGLVGMPDMPVYAASKFAVVGLSESLRADLREHKIDVSTICPGVIDTPIVQRALYEGSTFTSESAQKTIRTLYRRRAYPPSKVAHAIVRAAERGAGLVPVTPESWLIWMGQRIAPGLIARFSGSDKLLARFAKGA